VERAAACNGAAIAGLVTDGMASKCVLEGELDNAWVDAGTVDPPACQRVHVGQEPSGTTLRRTIELGVVEQVEELCAELERLPLSNARGLQNGRVEVKLAGAGKNAHTGISVVS